MAKRVINSTPRQDGFRMPGEFEKQAGMWMLWPERNDNWRNGGKPAQEAFANVAKAIAEFEPCLLYTSELGKRNITVNAIAPGFIDTDMTMALSEKQRELVLGQISLGR